MAICTSPCARILVLSTAIITAVVGPWALRAQDDQITRAMAFMDYMFYNEAVALFEQVLEKRPAERGIRVNQAFACFRLKKYEEAAGLLGREHEMFPGDLRPLILLSLIQDAMGRPEEAVATARAVQTELDGLLKSPRRKKVESVFRDLSPNAGLPAYILGLDASRRQAARSARSWFFRAQALGYDPMDCQLQAIDAEMRSGNWNEALKLTSGPGPRDGVIMGSVVSADLLVLKAIILEQLGRRDECRDSLEEGLGAEPFRTDILTNLAILDLQCAQFEEAARTLTKVIKLTPLDFRARYFLEQAQVRRRLPEGSSTEVFSRDFLKARGPRFVYVLNGCPEDAVSAAQTTAVDFIKRGLLADAALHLRMFTDIYQGSPSVYYNLGQLDNSLGLLAEALACGAKALGLRPDYRDAYDLMGNAYLKVGDFANAVHSYKSAVRLDPRDPMGFFNLACAFHASGDDASAEKNWLESLRLEKIAPEAGASARAAAGALDHSLTVKVEPVSAPCCEYLGLLYARQGKTMEAIDYFDKAISFNPGRLIPYLEIGKLHRTLNNLDKAREYFEKYLALGGDKSNIK